MLLSFSTRKIYFIWTFNFNCNIILKILPYLFVFFSFQVSRESFISYKIKMLSIMRKYIAVFDENSDTISMHLEDWR